MGHPMTNPRHSDFCHVVGFCHILWLIPWEKPKYMAKANYMAKVRVSKICHWMAFASVLWQNPGRLQKVTSMGFVMEWLLPYNKHNRFSQLYIAFFNIISEMKHQINCKRL